MTQPSRYFVFREAAFRCDNCRRLALASEIERHDDGGTSLATDDAEAYYWDPERTHWRTKHGERRSFDDVPAQIAAAATEATFCHSMGAFRTVGSMARAVIEATGKDKGCGGATLATRIDALAATRHLREHTKQQAHEVRYFGNDMAHGDFTDPVAKEEASEVTDLMAEILDEVYQSPARLERARQARIAKKTTPTQ